MRGIGKVVLILTVFMMLTGCRIYEEQKQAVVQTVSAAVLSPFVDAQKEAPLTQATFKPASADKPKPVEPELAPISPPPSKCTCEMKRKIARNA